MSGGVNPSAHFMPRLMEAADICYWLRGPLLRGREIRTTGGGVLKDIPLFVQSVTGAGCPLTMREFLKPDRVRILTTLIFLGLTYFYKVDCSAGVFMCEAYGFPASYFRISSGDFVYHPEYSVLWVGLVVDLVFWYLVSSGIVFALMRLMKRR